MSQIKLTKTKYPHWLRLYVSKLQGELKLAHWKIDFGKTYCTHAAEAEILIFPAQNSAELTLSNGWRKWSPSVLRATVAHELMHCHVNPINELAEEYLEELAPKTFQERKKGLDYINERVTDGLAEMVSVHLTLPRLPSRAQSRTLSNTLPYSRTLKSNKKSGTKGNRAKGSVKKRTQAKKRSTKTKR